MKNTNLSKLSDYELMQEIAKGNYFALNTLMDRYYKRVFNTAYKFMTNYDDAEEIAQDVFVKVFKSANTYKPTAKFSTWLYTITSRLCFNLKRNKKTHREVELNPDYMQNENVITDPVKLVAKGEINHIIRAAVASLPDKQKMAIILNKWEHLTYAQIADIMNMSEGAVKSLLFRGRETLKQKLEKLI